MKILFIITALLALTGCDALHKMHQARQLEKAQEQFAIHPDSFAQQVAKAYPVLPEKSIDTTSKINDSAYINTIKQLSAYIDIAQHYNDSVVNSIRSKTIYDTVGSSACHDAVNDLLNLVQKQRYTIDTLKNRIASIPAAVITKPLPVPVANDGAMQALKNESAGKDKTIAILTDQHKSDTIKIKTRGLEVWITWGILILIAIIALMMWIKKLRTG